MKALEGTFNKEKALVGTFSGHCETMRRFVHSSISKCHPYLGPWLCLPGRGAVYHVAELVSAGRGLGARRLRQLDDVVVAVGHLLQQQQRVTTALQSRAEPGDPLCPCMFSITQVEWNS